MDLLCYGLVIFIWGNVSVIDWQCGLVVIKFSGIVYELMIVDDMLVVDLQGYVVEGCWCFFFDIVIYLVFYCCYFDFGGVVYIYLMYVIVWVQVGLVILVFGIIYVDYFFGDIFCIWVFSVQEVDEVYELNIGQVIIEMLGEVNLLYMLGIVVYQYGLFVWGKDVYEVVYNVVVMEEVVCMVWIVCGINLQLQFIDSWLMNKYFQCKYGLNVYYG